MKLVGRSTCLYCESDGITTELVPAGGTLNCPHHSADFIRRSNPVPDGYVLIKRVTEDEQRRGRPNWPHRTDL